MRTRLFLVLLAAVVLLGGGCTTRHLQQASTEVTDSVSHRVTARVDTVRKPADSTRIALGTKVVLKDTLIYVRNEQASARIEVIGDSLYVNAYCDAWEKLVISYSEELERVRIASQTSYQERTRSMWPSNPGLWLLGVVVLVLILISIIRWIRI